MKEENFDFLIYFWNNGDATFQTSHYCHVYNNMSDLNIDVLEYISTKDTSNWDGNEPKFRINSEINLEKNGQCCIWSGSELLMEIKEPHWNSTFLNELEFLHLLKTNLN